MSPPHERESTAHKRRASMPYPITTVNPVGVGSGSLATSESDALPVKRRSQSTLATPALFGVSAPPRKAELSSVDEEGDFVVVSASKNIFKETIEHAADFESFPPPADPRAQLPPCDTQHALVVPKRAPQLQFYGKKTGIAYDVRMRYHSHPIADPRTYIDPHPEDPRRTFRIYRAIAEAGLIEDETLQGGDNLGELMRKLPTREATEDELKLVHTQQMIDFIKSTAGMGLQELQKETDRGDSIYLNNDSNMAARLSAGGAIEACRGVVEGTVKNAIAVIRPPGHHAEPNNPAGFCLFGNVSIASQVMLETYPNQIKKILVYDWDIHHGNGTQRAFLDDDRVLYMSTHRYENGAFYPGSKFGAMTVVGDGRGAGHSVNIPWKTGGMGDGDYLTAFHQIIMPIAAEFDPDLVIVSAGFDAAEGDPIGGCHVTPEGYQNMLAMLMTLARGKVVVCLEGGYSLDAISRSALAITKTLLGDPPGRPTSSLASNEALEVLAEVRAVHSQYWRSMGPPVIKFEPEIAAYNRQQHELSEQAEQAREGSEGSSSNEAEMADGNELDGGANASTNANAGSGANAGLNASGASTNASGASTNASNASPNASGVSPNASNASPNASGANASPSPNLSSRRGGRGSRERASSAKPANGVVQSAMDPEPVAEMRNLKSLLEVVRADEVQDLSQRYNFSRLPLIRAPRLESELMSTPNVYEDDKVMLVFHGPSLIWAYRDPVTGRIRPDESVVANPAVEYIKWASKNGYGIVDVFMSPLETVTPAKIVSYICDNTIRFFKAKQIVVLGAGQAYSYAVQLCAHRELKDRLSSIVCFVGPEDTLRQYPTTSDDYAVKRFYDRSLIFVSQLHSVWNKKYSLKKFGRMIKADGKNMYAVMREKYEEAVEYIDAEDDDEDENESDDGASDDSSDNGSDESYE